MDKLIINVLNIIVIVIVSIILVFGLLHVLCLYNEYKKSDYDINHPRIPDNYGYITMDNSGVVDINNFDMMDKYNTKLCGMDVGEDEIILNSHMILDNKILITLPEYSTRNYQIIIRR